MVDNVRFRRFLSARRRNAISRKNASIIAAVVIVIIAIAAYFVITQSGIGASSPSLKIAYIASGPCNDLGYYQGGCVAVKNMTNVAQVNVADNVADANYLNVARQFADQGYNVIFGQGFEAIAPFAQLAPSYPKTLFAAAALGFKSNSSNFISYYADNSGSAYLTGVLAGYLTKSNHIGFVSGIPIPAVWSYENAFKLGAWSVNKNIIVTAVFTQDFNDPAKGLQAGNSLIQQGVDFIYVGESPGGTGTYQACQSAKILCAGNIFDQNSLAPQNIATSAVSIWKPVMTSVVNDYQSHQVKSAYLCGIVQGCADIASFHGLVPSDIASKVTAVRSQILAGQIAVPFITDHELGSSP